MPTIVLTETERAAINHGIEGQGGFQTLIRRLRAALQPTGEVTISDRDVALIRRYRNEYGQGGWQDRLDTAFGRTLGPLE